VWSVALYDAEQKFYYLKRFQLEPSQKQLNFLGDNAESHLMLMTDVDYPRFEVVFGGNDAFREALVIDGEEFIGIKSYKAKGKRMTTFEVETINELDPVRFARVIEENSDENNGEENGENSEETDIVEVEESANNNELTEVEEVGNDNEVIEITDISEEIEAPTEPEEPKKPKEKTAKQKKEKTIKTIPNDSVLPDDIVDNGKINDDITGQLTLF
jgi:topoisomerase-4 subunit A